MTCFSCFFKRSETPPVKRSVEIDEEVSGIQNVNMYSYKELSIATGDFSPVNKIGQGGFGSVYKGRLSGGSLAAIKVLSPESRQGVREFLTEIDVISRIEHKNLVKLEGCCVEGNHRILVYEYLENNSLAQTLLGRGGSRIQFDWATRSKICIGIACGLAFLHGVEPHIVHRDIKASNILLDKYLNPKIADFGLAKLLPSNMTHVSTRVAGTIGYLAPEYAIRGQLTRRADIYSFGVLLMEIISGRCNADKRLPVEEQYLLQRAWELHKRNELVLLVDSSLNGDYDHGEACRFLKVGLLCTQEMSRLRPTMATVVKMLMGEMEVDDENIMQPGFLTDFKDMKIGGPAEKADLNTSHSISPPDNSSHSTTNTTYPSLTFTAISDRSS